MSDEPAKTQDGKTPAKWTVSPSTLRMIQLAADEVNRQNEVMKHWLEQPLRDLAKFAEIQKEQETMMRRMLEMVHIPSLNPALIKYAISLSIPKTEYPHRIDGERPRQATNENLNIISNVSPAAATTLVKAIERLAAAQEKSNHLMEQAQRIHAKDNKGDALTLVLDEDAKLYLQNKPKNYVDLAKAPLQKRILNALAHGHVPSGQLFARSKTKSKDSFYKAIGELNSKSKNKFKLKDKPVSNDGSGYCLHKAYRLISKLTLE
jgi:hypothetical protein